jgi:amino acid transporter
MGLNVYLPPVLGKTHSRWNTPFVALIVQAVVSSLLILLSLYGSDVKQAYEKLLSSSVAIQLIPFLYLFAGLWKLKKHRVWAALGFLSTAAGVIFVFIPSTEIKQRLRFFLEVSISFAIMIGIAVALFAFAKRRAGRAPAR